MIDLQAQYRAIKPQIDKAIRRVVTSGQFILGPEVEAFEREMAAFCHSRHAIGVASGTDALELALRACGVGPGDEVITTAYSFFATAGAIVAVGARPVFVDIEPVTYTLDPTLVKEKVTRRTKAIIPVHLYGHPCAMDSLMALARSHRLKVIEDCAQAIGAGLGRRQVGTFGDAGCFSFYPTKNLGGFGDGGMVVTNHATLAGQVRLMRAHGSRARYHHEVMGTNSRLDELQAAILRVKLRRLNQWNHARRRLAQRYDEAIHRAGLEQVVRPQQGQGYTHVYHLYCVRVPRRDRVQHHLAARGIATQVAYPSVLPSQPALRSFIRSRATFPQAEAVARDILALPMYPELTDEQIERVVKTLAESLKTN